ncbi:MAG: hypothetical protein RL563_1121 [Pseudomonadota bacterium]
MSVIPFGIAWYLAEHPQTVNLGTNNGELIEPPSPTELAQFTGYDEFSSQNLKELQGHWIMVNVLPTGQCGQSCQDALHKTRQISLMMGKDIARIRRLALLYSAHSNAFSKEWQEDARLLKAIASPSIQENLHVLAAGGEEGMLLIMDPLGNLMMKYPAGYDPYKVRNDLSKLLRISQIG